MQTEITSRDQWEALPAGTVVDVHYFETDDDGPLETMRVLRAAEAVLSAVGGYWLAGGKHWSHIWDYQQGATVAVPAREDTPAAACRDDSIMEGILAGKDAFFDHRQKFIRYMDLPITERLAHGAPGPQGVWVAIIERLLDLGWEPPVQTPEGTQVWTITGTPAETPRSDGTMAYLSLPKPESWTEVEDRSDIWLENPTVTVIGERSPQVAAL